jgi:ubiquinone/menaquinone biosynthesis C-methylase UbiE
MKEIKTLTEKHYFRPNLYEDIINRLEELEVDLNNVNRNDIAGVDEFHVRGSQISKELAKMANIKGAKILDIGCGIGGPCRMLADEFDCATAGIDLSEEFIRTATKLSELVGLSNKTAFICGDATKLPFTNKSFNAVWTQHVQMNVLDKEKFYSEIHRVLDDNGTFIYYDIFKNSNEDVNYPMPWANTPEISFLTRENNIDIILNELGFSKVQSTNETNNGIIFFEKLLEKINKFGPPKLGLNVLMGKTTKSKIVNLLDGLKEGKIILQSGIYKK